MILQRTLLLLLPLVLSLECTTGTQEQMTQHRTLEDGFQSIIENPSSVSNEEFESKKCECVPYNQCRSTYLDKNGQIISYIRKFRCQNYLDVCCAAEGITHFTFDQRTSVLRSGCGWRNPNGVDLRSQESTNSETKFGEFPWMVAVLKQEIIHSKALTIYVCGGSLIHPRVVLTAAHCVKNDDIKYTVRAGEWDTQSTREPLPHQNRHVESVILHPDFYSGSLQNDVALLLLQKPFDLDEHVNVICLPGRGTSVANGTRCWGTGWGKDQFGAEGVYQVTLKKIDLPFVDSRTCQNTLRTTKLGRYFLLHKTFICAGGEPGKDMCKGDGGSPLVCPISGQKNRYRQVGIASWGIGCGQNGVPGVYGNVALFRKWIDNELDKIGIDTLSYQY